MRVHARTNKGIGQTFIELVISNDNSATTILRMTKSQTLEIKQALGAIIKKVDIDESY